MPELPDVTVYVEALGARTIGRVLRRVRIRGTFLVRSVEPPVEACEGRAVRCVERLGKRVVIGLEGDLFLVLHLMIAGRFRWIDPGPAPSASKIEQARFTFDCGTLVLTEAGSKKRASLHVAAGRDALDAHGPGGLEVLAASPEQFARRLTERNHTLKRALTDPRLFSGIGNAYSDEILHAARLSPLRLTKRLDAEEIVRLFDAIRSTLLTWTDRLRADFAMQRALDRGPQVGRFPGPGEITAFRNGFAVHGRFGKPCPVCKTPVQRIVYAENECNYCPRCQTEGRVLADRSLSRLLKKDWPRSIEELEDTARSS